MEFNRTTVYRDEINNSFMNSLLNKLSSFGFCRRDGEDLVFKGDIDSITGTDDEDLRFRWAPDTTNNIYFQAYNYSTDHGFHYDFDFYMNGSHFLGDVGHDYSVIIFIPLKDNNFLLQLYRPQDKNIVTPPFITNATIANEARFDGGATYTSYHTSRTILSFNNYSNILKPYCYLLFEAYQYNGRPYLNPNYCPSFNLVSNTFEKGFGNLLNIEPNSSGSVSPTLHTYNNVNQNVCTLVRVPYSNTFVSGLYLCTTYPCDQIEGKVFSFNGRSFLGVYENLVVELPAN